VLGEFAGEDEPDTATGSEKKSEGTYGAKGPTYEVWISRDEMVDFLL
jgi:hypothetical protein